MGGCIGTILSGLLYQWDGLAACLWASVAFVLGAGLLSLLLPTSSAARPRAQARRYAAATTTLKTLSKRTVPSG